MRPKQNWKVIKVEVFDEPVTLDHLPIALNLGYLNF
jgi:hypothetical protein